MHHPTDRIAHTRACYTSRGALAGTRNSSMGKRSILDLMRIKSVFYHWECNESKGPFRCLYTKSNPIDDHSNISSTLLQKPNFKQRCHLVRFIRKPYGFLRFARAYERTMQSLRIFMIFADSHLQSFSTLYIRTVVSLQ